jgi:Zn-dependent M28 family amino/carboxypeptidase
MRISCKSIGIVVFLLASVAPAAAEDISAARLKAHTRFLAHDLMEGRGVGEPGGTLAEEYLATALASFGVKPAGENRTFFQTVPMLGVKTQPDAQLTVAMGGKTLPLTWQTDFVGATHLQKRLTTFDAEAVFVGHGIVSKSENWDDYKGTDVKGKIVVVFTNEPQPDNPQVFKGKALTYAGRWTYKFEEAARQGALGCLIIHTTPTAGYGWEVVRNSWSKEDPQMKLELGRPALTFAGWVTQDAGAKMLGLAGKTVDGLMKAADSRDFKPVPLGFRIKGRLNAKIRDIQSRNVFGIIPGSDAKLKEEVVMYSAHWDHLGKALPINGDAIYNGAIDNATGCAVVLEIARVFSELQTNPRRSIVFAFWTAEESGLRGAEYYAQHPLFPPAKTAINLNYDALFPSARTRDVVVTGAERTTACPVVQEAAARLKFEITPDPRPEQGSYYRSDHFMLAKIGIPAFKIGTGSKIASQADDTATSVFREYNTKHYHQPTDEFNENWDFTSLEFGAKFGYMLGLNVANATAMPAWNAGDEFAVKR